MVRTLVLDGLSKAANSLGFALKQTEKQHQKTRSFFLGVLQRLSFNSVTMGPWVSRMFLGQCLRRVGLYSL